MEQKNTARNGYANCLKLLIKNWLDVNAKNKYGSTAGHEAAESGYMGCLKLLIESGLERIG